MDRAAFEAQLPYTLQDTHFERLGPRYEGKVRDTYAVKDRLLLITTDRLSAFDRVLTTLPFKGDLLNRVSHFWFEKTRHIVPNHALELLDDRALLATRAQPLKVEFVVRGYLAGSLWRAYASGADPHGLALPPGLTQNSAFPAPVLTPSTKAPVGEHDAPLSPAEVVARGLMTAPQWAQAAEAAVGLFLAGQAHARRCGLLLVDTKYEFGLDAAGKLLLIDELHSPDSSRFWEENSYAERHRRGEDPVMLDKENLRQWLLRERQFQGTGPLPEIPDTLRVDLALTYARAFERLTGTAFAAQPGDSLGRLTRNLTRAGLL